MSIETINRRDRKQELQDRLNDMADLLTKESRPRNEAEEREYSALLGEIQAIEMCGQAANVSALKDSPQARQEAMQLIRENASAGRKTEIVFTRDIMTVSDMKSGAAIPLNVQDILKPLVEGFILDKVGLPMPTGLSGDYVWPTYEMVEATVLGEGAALTDTKIPFSKLTANPARIGIAIPVSNQSLTQTDGLLEMIVRDIMPMSVRILLNKILFSTKAVNQAAQAAGLVGPFVEALSRKVSLSNPPTATELALMRAKVLETGIDGEKLCWSMTKSMEATLESTPEYTGSPKKIIEDGKLCRQSVYTTNECRKVVKVGKKATVSSGTTTWADYVIQTGDTVKHHLSGDSEASALATATDVANNDIAEVTVITEYIGIGDWRQQVMGLFGSLRFIVDPYSQARKDAVDFVLNCDYGTKTLRPEAFLIGEVGAKSAD